MSAEKLSYSQIVIGLLIGFQNIAHSFATPKGPHYECLINDCMARPDPSSQVVGSSKG